MPLGWVALALAAAVAGCKGGAGQGPAAPGDREQPRLELAPMRSEALCATRGAPAVEGARLRFTDATVRAVALDSDGDAAAVRFVYHGQSEDAAALASGQVRRQLGLKLRAGDGCNVVYIMYRLDPRPFIEVSVKHNPGKRTHRECGTGGYAKIKPQQSARVPHLSPGASHTLQAELLGDELAVWLDGKVVWQGRLGRAVGQLRGPAGFRSDNVEVDAELLVAPRPSAQAHRPVPGCPGAR